MKKYRISFYNSDESLISSKLYYNKQKIKISSPKKMFYKFIGWSPQFVKYANQDQNYYAQYLPINDNNKNGIADEEEFIEIISNIINSKEYQKRKKYKHHGNTSVYEHCLSVAYYTYRISKKLHLDYESATIGAILHDFYYEDWQDAPKKPFLKKHGFVHAHEALENSRKFYPDILNKKIENSIERHMFPLNIVPPKYIESWIVSISDKYVSMDVLSNYKILFSFFNEKYNYERK